MTGRDLYTEMSYINNKFIQEAEAAPQKTRTSLRRTILVAAMLVLLLTLVGYAAVPAILDAAEPWISIPQVDGADIPMDDIQITVTGITPGALTYTCNLAGFGANEKSVVFYTDAPCTLERKNGSGWEMLPRKVDDTAWNANEILTDGHFDGSIRWSAHYGYLEVGTYRVTAQILQGHDAFCLEFEITEAMHTAALKKAEAIFLREFWHIRGIWNGEVVEYWKNGNDYLQLSYRGEEFLAGMMFKDGTKYKLAREEESIHSPIVGWIPWPDLDLNRLTLWELFENGQLRLEITPGKNNINEIWKLWISEIDDSRLDEGVTFLGTLEIMDTSAEEISQMIHQQDTNGLVNP